VDGHGDASKLDPGEQDPRISRLLDAVRRLERIASPEAVDALTRASQALDRVVLNMQDSGPQHRTPPDDVLGRKRVLRQFVRTRC
jgi:hypothetical protein